MTKPSPPQQVNSRSRSWLGLLLVAAAIVAAFFSIGLAVAAVWYSVAPKVYVSTAIVLISPRSLPPNINSPEPTHDFTYRHDQLIGEDNIIMKALIKYDLKELPTLRDLSAKDQIRHIQSDFIVRPTGQDESVYELRYLSRNPRDAQTVLATLASTYEKHLDEKFRSVSPETLELLRKMVEKQENDLAAQSKEIEQLEKQIAAGQTDEETQATLVKLREERELMINKLDAAASPMTFGESPKEETQFPGFDFKRLSPASKGYLVYPRLHVFLLAGGIGGLLMGLIAAGLMIAVFINRQS